MQTAETEIPLYNCNNEYMLAISLVEAQKLASDGEAVLKSKGLGRKFRITAVQLQRRQPANPSPTTLTKSDMLHNAAGALNPRTRKFGKDPDGNRNPVLVGNCIDRSMTKVEVWPYVHDDRNTCISAGVAFGVIFRAPVIEPCISFA